MSGVDSSVRRTTSSILQHGRYPYPHPLTRYMRPGPPLGRLSPRLTMMTMAALPPGGAGGEEAARGRTLLLPSPALPATLPAKRKPLGGLWQHLLVFVFGPRDDMSDVMVGDQPPAPDEDCPHHHQGPQQQHRHHMSPILVAPARGQTEFDYVVTAPTPPITSSSGSSSATSRTPDDALGTTTSGSGFDTSTTLRTANGTLRRAASDRPQYLSPSRARREPRHKTISDVTAEARKVLEQLILRHDADAALASGSALLPLSAGAAVRPRGLPTTSGISGTSGSSGATSGATSGAATATQTEGGLDEADGRPQRHSTEPPAASGGAPLPAGPGTYHRTDAVDIPDVDDDATSHEPVSGPNSTYSFSSRSSSHRNRIHLMTQITDEAQLKRAAAQQQQRKKKKKRKVRRIPSARRRGSTSSSSSSEYEIVDGQLRLRPKKSLFKRAKERLRQSFRRKKEPFDPYSIDDEELRQAEAQTPRTGNGATKRPFRLNFRHQRSGTQTLPADRSPNVGDRGFHSDAATSMHNGRSYCPAHDVTQNGAAHRDAATTPGDKDKNRSFLDNILRTLRRGGERLRRRASHRDTSTTAPPRSRSADAITVHSLRRDTDPRHQRPPRANNNRKSAPQEAETSTRGGAGLIYCRCQSLDSHVTRPRPPPLPALGPTPDDDDDVDFAPRDVMGHTSLTDRHTLRLHGGDVDVPGISGGRDVTSGRDETSAAPLQAGGEERLLPAQDELDGQVAGKSPDGPVVHTPFAEKTDQEKDELFEKIAEQLAAIADNYNLESPRSMKNADLFFKPPSTTTPTRTPSTTVPKSASAPLPAPTSPAAQPPLRTSLTVPVPVAAAAGGEGGAEGGARGGGHTPIEQKIGRLLRDKGDKAAAKDLSDFQPVVSELVRNASYSRFQQIIHENVGSEPGWQQVALVFNLTRSAVQLAGLGTAAALQIKELTLRYFEDRFAGWIVGQGGWESMVEDTDLSSEVD